MNIRKKKFDFISADGGIDEQGHYAKKESLHLKLILAQIVYILTLQRVDGSCILKLFETSSPTTHHLLYLLAKHYKKCTFIKPITSRPTNSERYFVCQGFTTNSDLSVQALIDLTQEDDLEGKVLFDNIPVSFLCYIRKHTDTLTKRQTAHINKTVSVIHDLSRRRETLDRNVTQSAKCRALYVWSNRFEYLTSDPT